MDKATPGTTAASIQPDWHRLRDLEARFEALDRWMQQMQVIASMLEVTECWRWGDCRAAIKQAEVLRQQMKEVSP